MEIPTEEVVLSRTYMTFGQAIRSLSAGGAMPIEATYPLWDLFTWNLDIAKKNGNLSDYSIDYIINGTEHPGRPNLRFQFVVPTDQMEWFAYSSNQLRDTTSRSFLDSHNLSSEFQSNMFNSMLGLLTKYDERFGREPESQALVLVWSVFLTTVLKDTDKDPELSKERRESAFFWFGMFACQWIVRSQWGSKTY
ncbi:MAG: hypothetical protein RJA33_296 [Actinomycetota bacterium]|jgi:hypothetical protein